MTSNIVNVLMNMKNQGYRKPTLKFVSKALKFLGLNANLNNPESVKTFIANYNTSEWYKKNLCIAYNHYVQYCGLTWEMPFYKPSEKRPKIPTEERLSMLISASPFKLATKLSISKETGLRPIELMNLRVRDVDGMEFLYFTVRL